MKRTYYIIVCLVALFVCTQNLNAQDIHVFVNTSTEFNTCVNKIKKVVDQYNTVIIKISDHDDQGMHDFLAAILPLIADKRNSTCFVEIWNEEQSIIDKFMNNNALTFKDIYPGRVNYWFRKLEVLLNSLRKNHIKTVCSDVYEKDADLDIRDKFTLDVIKKTSSAKNIVIIGASHFRDLTDNQQDNIGVITLRRGYFGLHGQEMTYTNGHINIEIPKVYPYSYRDDNLIIDFSDSIRLINTASSISKAQESGAFIDNRDGHKYKWITIGEQVWMAENLVYIPSSGYYYTYGDLEANAKALGTLYDWETAQKVCPKGWKLSAKSELEKLLSNYNGEVNALAALVVNGSSGFNAQFGGTRTDYGHYYWINTVGAFLFYYLGCKDKVHVEFLRKVSNFKHY